MAVRLREGRARQKRGLAPVDAILEVEFATLSTPRRERERVRGIYEEQSALLLELLTARFAGKSIEAIPEEELFPEISRIYYSKFPVAYDSDAAMSEAVLTRKDNCRFGSLMAGDVLSRLGREVGVIIAPQHVLLKGRFFSLETGSPPEDCIFPNALLTRKYPVRQEAGLDSLLALAYNWRGMRLCGMGRHAEELAAYSKALEICPGYIQAMENKGIALGALHRFDESRAVFKEAARISPLDSRVERGERFVMIREIALLDEGNGFKPRGRSPGRKQP
ncbi:MAG: tetratricopeptide repeat protein [Candidatus ainarchaeum sp.]|nr:tetratricopeptide repeat protein [Candidatus ainarchaeum sp.]